MSQTLNHDNSITVTAYSLHEFVFEMMELAQKGFCPTLENNKIPSGGFGSYYTATVVPINSYRIELDGNHVNVPKTEETQPEVKLHTEEPKQDVESVPVTQNEKVQSKTRTQTKKTI